MSMTLRLFAIVAIAGSVLVSASAAEAGKIRSTAERRQHPGRGFWDDSHKPSVQKSFWNWNQHYSFWDRLHQPNSTPKQKSWGWQRSSRAELHHPGPRASRDR